MKTLLKFYHYCYEWRHVLAFAFAALIFVFVRYSLSQNEVPVVDKPSTEDTIEVAPTVVHLDIVQDNVVVKTYRSRIDNVTTVEGWLNRLRDNDGLEYERIAYIYGTELDHINGVAAPQDYKWHLYEGSEDITFQLEDRRLGNKTDPEKRYKLILEKTSQ
ncbi:MAG: hypothetical protein R3B92_02945 [Patescibacteria group bacterium]